MYPVDTIGDVSPAVPPVPQIPGNPFPSLENWLPHVPGQVPGGASPLPPIVIPGGSPTPAPCACGIPIVPVAIAFGVGAIVAFLFLKR